MEIDTAACKSMLSYDRYKALVDKCQQKKISPPVLVKDTVIMRQADGSVSDSVIGCIDLHIKRPESDKQGTFKVLIVNGPNNLLGKPVLKALWPENYQALAESAYNSTVEQLCALIEYVMLVVLL